MNDPTDDFDALILDAVDSQASLSRYIDRRWRDLSPRDLAGLLSTHAMNALRIALLLRDRRALAIPGPDPIQLDGLIADLTARLARLSRYIDARWRSPGMAEWRTLVAAHSLILCRLSRLITHRRTLRRHRR